MHSRFRGTHPLEWGWHTSSASNFSSTSEWKPKPTLIGGASSSPADGDGTKVAAWGDLKCQGVCSQGGSRGTTAMYRMEERNLCANCAVKAAGAENLPSDEQVRILQPFLLRPK